MRYIPQKDKHGCGVAVLAMLTNQSYDVVKDYLSSVPNVGDIDTGISDFVMRFYLYEFNYAVAMRFPTIMLSKTPRENLEPFSDVAFACVDNPAHYIVLFRDGTVLDPARPKRRHITEYNKINHIGAVVRIPPDIQ